MIKIPSLLKFRFATVLFILVFYSMQLFSENKYNIIPYPQQLIPQSGTFEFNAKTRVLCDLKDADILKLAHQFSEHFQLVSGRKLNISDIFGIDTANAIVLEKILTTENPEAYRLNISPKTIRIQAGSPNGFFYGLQSLYQLMPVEIYGSKKVSSKKWSAPAVQITDAPRFGYRGLHLDVCRHFFPIEFIKKYIDAMAIHKMNYFHWHLTDDQGWRIQIKKYPRLTEIGSKRDETLVGYYYSRYPQQFDGKPYGGFYTQDEAREIVAYARDRYITVIPEIEMPGHAQAAIAAYPYLSCTKDSTIKVATKWGVFPDVFCPRDTTFHFLEDVLTEIMAIFPSKYIHIGGDECPKDRWKKCPDCQALIKSLNLKDENGLQSYFTHRMEKFLNSKGRQIIGWDEILDGGLAPNATVMSWRGTQGGIAAAKAGHDVIMTPSAYCYYDHYQSDPTTEPATIGGYLPLETAYRYEPVPTELSEEEARHILGAQANLWAEYLPTTESVEYMAFPRVSAMAELQWSTRQNRNWDLFRQKMNTEFERYSQLGIKPSKAFYDVHFKTNMSADKKLQVTLSCDCPDAQVQYQINKKWFTYNEPLTLNESTIITAKAMVNGKQAGKSITKQFVVSKLTGLSYTKSLNNTWYDGGGVNALTDGIPGNTLAYSQWVGVSVTKGKEFDIIVDLKDSTVIQRFSIGLLQAKVLCVILPSHLKLYGSANGTDYQLLAEKEVPASASPVWEMIRPELTFQPTNVRYLKLTLTAGDDSPADCPDPMHGSLVFMDEMGAW